MGHLEMDEDWAKIQKEKLLRKLQNGDISQEEFDARDKKLDEEKKDRKTRTNKILEIQSTESLAKESKRLDEKEEREKQEQEEEECY